MRFKVNQWLLKLIIVIGFLSTIIKCDVFSSTAHLKSLMYLERHIISTLNVYIKQVEEKLTRVKSYIDEFSRTAGRPEFEGTDSSDEIIGNPIQAFQLIKRLTIDWNYLQGIMRTDDWQSVEDTLTDYQYLLPRDDDLKGAALALVRLTDTYKLNMSDVSKGRIVNYNTRVKLTARDCLYIGKHSFNNGYYGQSLDWFQEALTRAYIEGNRTASVDEIVPFYNMAIQIHDEVAPEFWRNVSLSGNESIAPHAVRFLDGDNDDYRNYQALCRGENFKIKTPSKELKCFYSNMGNPWLTLQPIKVEIFHQNPLIAMYHGLLSDKESDAIRDMAAPQLTRAKVQTDLSSDEISDTRTSQTAWFAEDEHEIVSRINRRIEAVTGLSTEMHSSHSELMQVANYGMGGHYTPHYDYLIVDRPPEERHLVAPREAYAGDRTATLMFYLSDVFKGGGTVFPQLGVRLEPRKNSAAFWYNLLRNGEAIVNTTHGACPVLLGEKWVANHWIREIGQAFRRKCSLNPEE